MKQKLYFKFLIFFSVLFFALINISLVSASDLTSPSFIVKDPLIGTGGGYYSSGTFQLRGAGNPSFSGYSTALDFIGKFGFLYFPVTIPVVIPPVTPGGGGGSGEVVYTPILPGLCARIADFNCDGEVNILDLSILLYYTDKGGSEIVPYDLNQDGTVDLMDISILFYYWDF